MLLDKFSEKKSESNSVDLFYQGAAMINIA